MSPTQGRPTATGLIATHFLKINSFLGGVSAIVIGILVWHYLPTEPVPLWLVALLGTIGLTLLLTLVQALREAVAIAATSQNVKVVDVVGPHPPFTASIVICVVQSSVPLPIGAGVTVYAAEDGFERQIGVGTVRHIQNDGKSQVTLDWVHDKQDSIIDELKKRDRKAIDKLRLDVQVSFQYFDLVNRSPGLPAVPSNNPTTPPLVSTSAPSPPALPSGQGAP